MNENTLKERTKRLLEINKIIKKLDSAIRPAAFLLLEDYVLSSAGLVKEPELHPAQRNDRRADHEKFFSKFNHSKASDNVLLICAYLYGQYGSSPFGVKNIKTLADEVGVTVPDKPYMTIKAAQRKGKSLFRSVGGGLFCPTVHGEKFLKETYKVSKGTQQKPQDAE